MRVKLAYYSGTGGSARIAQCFAKEFSQLGASVDLEHIQRGEEHKDTLDNYELLVLVTVVHDFSTPHQALLWIDGIESSHQLEAAIFSVSGGGEAVTNRASRKRAIQKLEAKGITVTYEDMFAMPCNYTVRTNDLITAMEMAAYPMMAADATRRILAGEKRRTKTPVIDRLVSRLMQNAWKRGEKFGRSIEVLDSCRGCSRCVKTCSASNIILDEETHRPVFSNRCTVCLACFYVCPESALKPGRERFAVLKDGYDLEALEQLTLLREDWNRIDELCHGILWSGLKPYLTKARELLFSPVNQD